MATVSKAITSKNALPILDCVKIHVNEENDLVLTGGNTEAMLSITCPTIEVENPYPLCINAALLSNALGNLGNQPITLEASGKEITLVYDRGHFNFPSEDASEYPADTDNIEAISHIELPCSQFSDLMKLCRGFVGHDELRPVMNGVYLDMNGEHLVAAATDGHRLVRKAMPEVKRPETRTPMGVIVSERTAGLLALLPKEGNVILRVNERQTAFFADRFKLVATSIEGKYPNYNSVIPQTNPYTVEVNRAELMAALRRVSTMGSSTGLVRLQLASFMGGEGRLTVSSEDKDFAQSGREEINVTHNAPDNFAIGFKSEFLSALLATHTTSTVVLKLADASRAGVMLDDKDGDAHLLSLLMPMQLQ